MWVRKISAPALSGRGEINPRWNESIEAARAVQTIKAAKRLSMVHPIIDGLRSSGIDTMTGLANALNERGIKTGQGSRWHPQTVKRVLEALV